MLTSSQPESRRRFLTTVAVGAGAAAIAQPSSAGDDQRTLVVGVMGLSRGLELAREFSTKPNCRVKYLCDADSNRIASAVKGWDARASQRPEGIQDWQQILSDKEVNILVCAAPNHWHAPATILACAAGKHVYCEKPCSHNPQEGEWMVQAAAKHRRCVQIGTQRRSSPMTRSAIEKLHQGVIGRTYLSRAYYNNARGPIRRAEPSDPPAELRYDLWQGPAEPKPYQANVLHYNWHWFWNWGGGELANNGVHTLDLCRWGLGVEYPMSVCSSGGRYAFDDAQETPDTQTVAWEFADRKQITWQSLSCNKHGGAFIEFIGDNGAMELDGDGGHRIFDRNDKLVEDVKGNSVGQAEHVENFLAAVRADDPALLNCPITTGHPSTLLCHLGNISQRAGLRLVIDPANGKVTDQTIADRYWKRTYADGWESKLRM
jgi:predicted dehydrogenase